MRHPMAAVILVLASLSASPGFGQSLGDVARQQQQKKQVKGTASPSRKVVTNEDLPESASQDSANKSPNGGAAEVPHATNDTYAAHRWKAAILQQKQVIAEMQQEVDQRKATIHFVEANRYHNGVEYNQHQLLKLQEVEALQKQLAEQQKRLELMQEAARRSGLGSAVYDP